MNDIAIYEFNKMRALLSQFISDVVISLMEDPSPLLVRRTVTVWC